jgi:carboxymethylenebutenolidase
MYHFGERDSYIPPEDVEKIRAHDPNGVFHVYPADHGFNCDERASYDAASAKLARERTLAFLVAQMEKK